MPKKTKWEEIARRGKAHPVLLIDSLFELYKDGYFAKAHQTKWGPKNYRQFDDSRWFGAEDIQKYKRLLEKAANSTRRDLFVYAREYKKRIAAYYKFGEKYKKIDFSQLNNQVLAKIMAEWFEHTKRIWSFAYDYIYINKFLPDIITSVVASKISDIWEQNKILGALFEVDQPSEMRQEKRALVNIAKQIRHKKLKLNDKKLESKIKTHLDKYAHLGFYYFRGSAYTLASIKKRLKEYLALSDKEFKKMLDDFVWQDKNPELTKKYIQQLNLDKQIIKYIYYVKRWGTLSNDVDETYGFVVYHLMSLWQEIAKRLEVSYTHFYSLTSSEIIKALKDGKLSAKLKKQAPVRYQDHALILENGKKRMLIGKQIEQYRKQQKKKDQLATNIKELKGQVASPGTAQGKVRIIFSVHDVQKVERGNILVASSTNPTYVPAMERAGAIVTDEGGLLSHAAIVSRELKVPCVVGAKIATKILHDGQLVEVDANKGIVRILK